MSTTDWYDTRDRNIAEEITTMVDDGSIKVVVQLAVLSKLLRVARTARAWNEERKVINDRSKRNEAIVGSPMRLDILRLTNDLDEALDALIVKHKFDPARGL